MTFVTVTNTTSTLVPDNIDYIVDVVSVTVTVINIQHITKKSDYLNNIQYEMNQQTVTHTLLCYPHL